MRQTQGLHFKGVGSSWRGRGRARVWAVAAAVAVPWPCRWPCPWAVGGGPS
eukprot:NODE_1015_length_1095_cov_240.457935_g704_i0.p6 GENE.NODE_1015_length_1095_cov_240.457935_g704_i0~~NODE_1015_length_1095_cov_240.457935_g704_i0.p6  ORF type:complete len:51 (+),score=3.54 NODE_1015_length_1095_cov_240.457935_g704_i0:656-808(+)